MFRKRISARASRRSRAKLHRSIRVEPLERRYLLAIDTTFQGGVLNIVADTDDDIVVTADEGLVKINGADPASGPLPAEQVTELQARSAWSQIDLSGVWENREAFSSLRSAVQYHPPEWAVLGREFVEQAVDWWSHGGVRPWAEPLPPLSAEQVDVIVENPEWLADLGTSALPMALEVLGPSDTGRLIQSAQAKATSQQMGHVDWFELARRDAAVPAEDTPSQPRGLQDWFELNGAESAAAGLDSDGGGSAALAVDADVVLGGTVSVQQAQPVVEGGVLHYGVVLDADATNGFTVDYSTQGGTATGGPPTDPNRDYTEKSGTLTFLGGFYPEGGTAVAVSVFTNDDALDEPDETVNLGLSNLDNFDGGELDLGDTNIGTGSASGTILDDDVTVNIQSGVTVTEGDDVAQIMVSLSEPAPAPVRVAYQTIEGSATSLEDFGGHDSVILFPAESTDPLPITILIADDSIPEPTESFTVKLTEVLTGNGEIGNDTGTVTILDNDEEPTIPTVSISDGTQVEKGPDGEPNYMKFTVTLSEPTSNTVSVGWSTEDGMGEDAAIGSPTGPDYIISSGSVVFQPDDTEETILVEIKDDTQTEPNEHFFVNLGEPSNADPGDMQAKGTIIDDDVQMSEDDSTILDENYCIECGRDGTRVIMSNGDSQHTHDAGESKLINNSGSNPHPVFGVNYAVPELNTSGMVLREAQASISFGSVSGPDVFYSDAGGFAPGSAMRFAMQADATSLPSGTYDYTLTLELAYDDPSVGGFDPVFATSTLQGRRSIVNRIDSPYGNRWWIEDLDQLVIQGDDVTFISGSGYASEYRWDGASYVTPPGYFETLEKNVDGTYTLRDTDGSRLNFSSGGLLTERLDRLGNATTYEYDGQNRLETKTDPFGVETTFTYGGDGMLESIIDHAGRVTAIDIDANGLLQTITSPDPDGPLGPEEVLETVYTYDPVTHLVTSVETWGEITTTYEYDFALRVETVTNNDGTERELTPPQSLGLVNLSGGGAGSSAGNPAAFHPMPAGGFLGSGINEEGEPYSYGVDRFGYVTTMIDALGNETVYERDGNGLLTSVLHEDPDGGGTRVATEIEYDYDDRGNLLSETRPGDEVQTWTYDDDFSQITSYTDEEGRQILYDIDEANGDILSMTLVDINSDDGGDLVYEYEYTPTPDGITHFLPAGLLIEETDPEGRITKYVYADDPEEGDFGLLTSVTYAFGTADEATVQYEYDKVTRNLVAMIDELGRRTEYEYDNLDRMTKLIEPDPDDNPMTDNQPIWLYTYCACSGKIRTMTDPNGNVTEYEL